MTNRRIPTRVVETGRVVRGSSGQGVGWLQPIAERIRGLRAQLEGIHRRLSSPLVDGVPAAISGELLFKANTQERVQVSYPASPVGPDRFYPLGIVSVLCNPIVKAGQTYRIPILFPPPGVLSVQNLVVTLEAGMTEVSGINQPFIQPLNDYLETDNGSFNIPFTSNPYYYTWQQQILGDIWRTKPFLPFFWNIIDEKSGRQYAQDWMPHGALLNTRANGESGVAIFENVAPDGELFDFDTPWLFERDAQISFLFRPIMDLYQLDAQAFIDFNPPFGPYSSIFPYGQPPSEDEPPPVLFDDRNQEKRNQQLTVRVEMHGVRYYDRQDVLKEGAYV